MTLLALVYDPEVTGQLTNINVNDTLYIESVNRIITYHHKNGKTYKAPQRLEDFEKSSILRYMKLVRLDHRNFIKVSAIHKFDRVTGMVYFFEDLNFGPLGHVAEKNREFLDLSLNLDHEPLEMYALVLNEEETELMNINIDDCLMIESVNRIITFHHKNGKTYHTPQKMREFSKSLILRKLGIVRLDHRNYVHLTYIKRFDVKNGLVYFEEDPKPFSKKAHVAGKYRSFLEMEMELMEESDKIVNR
ncbi:hypothetical protein [Paenibacillus amylolyticus]|uniref:hypothetical protein n=1 Tax=Paenibacillus amylolyticus TaxID=1451 RepID=UPI003392F0FA